MSSSASTVGSLPISGGSNHSAFCLKGSAVSRIRGDGYYPLPLAQRRGRHRRVVRLSGMVADVSGRTYAASGERGQDAK